MEWSKEKTLKLIELLQVNATLWNPSLCDSRRDKQKRKEELRAISDVLGATIPDIAKKIQHLRTQYNRESAREARTNVEEPGEPYVSNWYAFEYLHFMKDSSKPYRILQTGYTEGNENTVNQTNNSINESKLLNISPVHKTARMDVNQSIKPETQYSSTPKNRDEFDVFGEYIANELRSLKGEKNLLVAKKKIQDIIFEMKMGLIYDNKSESSPCTVYTHSNSIAATAIHNGKIFTTPVMTTNAHIEPLTVSHTPTSNISEIIINAPCHYTNFKVDSQ